MPITEFSPKQRLAMKWWNMQSYCERDAIICDGAVRSGKTLSMSLGFVFWAADSFSGKRIAEVSINGSSRGVFTEISVYRDKFPHN